MKSNEVHIGDDVLVVSGPHEGRAGRVITGKQISIDGKDPEMYAVIEYTEQNCFKENYTDQISVPVRRLAARR